MIGRIRRNPHFFKHLAEASTNFLFREVPVRTRLGIDTDTTVVIIVNAVCVPVRFMRDSGPRENKLDSTELAVLSVIFAFVPPGSG